MVPPNVYGLFIQIQNCCYSFIKTKLSHAGKKQLTKTSIFILFEQTYPNCEVVDDWNPHIRVGFEAEREDRGTDEEDRHDPNCLRDKYWGLIEV